MKPVIFSIIISSGLLVSCYKPYTASVESDEKILVVDGMITNEPASYTVSLSYAMPFYSYDFRHPVHSAKVHVSDDLGNSFSFRDNGNGNYLSDSLKFKGQPGRTYTLHIETIEGETFESGLQKINKEYYPDTVYAEVDYQETISRFNEILVTVRGGSIMTDISSESDTLPPFRYTADLTELYFYTESIPPPFIDPPVYLFYCWETEDVSQGVNLAQNEYSLNVSSIKRHEVYFVDDDIYVEGKVYDLGAQEPDLSYRGNATTYRKIYNVSHRILYLNQFSLNTETYSYYRSMDEQLRSEGKLFDPIAVQLTGNMRCTSDPEKKVYGFFEASGVSRSSYIIGFRNHRNNEYLITRIQYKQLSQPDGCLINKVPAFWVN